MAFWIAAAAMTALAIALLLRPLLRQRAGQGGTAPPDLAVYRDQLQEIEREAAGGLIAPGEAAAARLEVERRLLAAAARQNGMPSASRRRPALAAAIAMLVPVAALGLYLTLGAPELSDGSRPPQLAAPADGTAADELARLVDALAARMREDPADPEGWLLLARSYAGLGRYAESADAYAAAIAQGAGTPAIRSAEGEALAAAAGGVVTPAARAAFEAALAADPADPRARYYLALAAAQEGDLEAALAQWVALEADTPAEAPWRHAVSAQIERAAAALGRDPAARPGRAAADSDRPPAPAAADMAAAAEMAPEEREAFVRSMVDGLAARLEGAPDDLEGWLRLARAYEVLGETEAARTAWARAAALAPARTDVLLGYAEAMLAARAGEEPLPPAFAETVQRIRALAPENALGLFFGGVAALEAGDAAEARRLWDRLLARLPDGSAERAELERRLDAIRGGG